jgi:sugar/nucleoside kinase (ribokinase family)
VNNRKFDILVAGEINPDLILTDPDLDPRFGQVEILVEDAALTPGSSSVIFACGAARLGLKVAFIGVVGDDFFGRFMLDALNNRGVDTSLVITNSEQKTGVTVILNRINDRGMVTHLGSINALREDQISDYFLEQTDHLHVASYFLQTGLQPGLPDLFRRAFSHGVTTSLDTNWDPAERWEGVHELLPLTTVFLPNENEALALAEKDTVEAAARELAERAQVVAVKMGSQGGLVSKGPATIQLPAIPVNVVDSVGAGDSFDAGFVYGFLKQWPLEKSLKLGIACGSLSTQKPGGTDGQPTLEAALEAYP